MAPLRPRVVTAAAVRITRDIGPSLPAEDGAVAKVVKYIPAEIIALQQLLEGGAAATGAAAGVQVFGWLSLSLLVLTPFWFAASTREAGQPVAWSQVVLSTVAFAIWLFAIDSPAVGILHSFGVPQTGLDKSFWSFLFAFFGGITPMLEKIMFSSKRI